MASLPKALNLSRLLTPRKAPQSPSDNAADSLLAKSAKLEVARQAILTQDLQALAQADREKVRRLEERLLFAGQPASKAGDDVGDIIVCDDYTANRNSAPQSNLPKILLGLTGLVAAAAGTGVAIQQHGKTAGDPPPPAAVAPGQAYDAVYERQQPDGTWKEFKRERLK